MRSVLSIIILTTALSAVWSCKEESANFDNLVKADEFEIEGSASSTMWGYDLGTGQNGWGNAELQYYTDRPENVIVEDGMLKIIARQESYQGSQYTSARIVTRDLFEQQYGRFEARMKLPWGRGIWPAFWLLGANCDVVIWPQCGEIDIMENRGQEPTKVAGSIHGPGYSAGDAITSDFVLTNDRFDTDFHTFAIEWTSESIKFFVDDIFYNEISRDGVPGEWVYDNPFYIIINVAVGGNYVGPPSGDTVFPQTLEVDYIRIYE